jgi:hypothetical protein
VHPWSILSARAAALDVKREEKKETFSSSSEVERGERIRMAAWRDKEWLKFYSREEAWREFFYHVRLPTYLVLAVVGNRYQKYSFLCWLFKTDNIKNKFIFGVGRK